MFTDHKLYQLDQKIKTIDPAWPVVAVAKDRQPAAAAKPTKIHVNPAFVGKVIVIKGCSRKKGLFGQWHFLRPSIYPSNLGQISN